MDFKFFFVRYFRYTGVLNKGFTIKECWLCQHFFIYSFTRLSLYLVIILPFRNNHIYSFLFIHLLVYLFI